MMGGDASKTAVRAVELIRRGDFPGVRELFTAALRPLVSEDMLRAAWVGIQAQIGEVNGVGEPAEDPSHGGAVLVRLPLVGERGSATLLVSVAGGTALAAIQVGPPSAASAPAPWTPPPYADPASFSETEVEIGPGSGALSVGGTLTLPRATAPAAAVMLLPGSGPLDRDETIGQIKVFKDLAWGLGSQGLAVLRFDKVTFARRGEIRDTSSFTLREEYIEHALAGLSILYGHRAIDPGRIFVLGHSLGGTVAPRVASESGRVRGLAILAGSTSPFHWTLVRQLQYLASLNPETAAQAEKALRTVIAQAERVDSPDLSPDTPAELLPLHVPASYWLDLRDYDPVALAASLSVPIFILQGGRDYQVTVEDDLSGWERGLRDRPSVKIRLYPDDNHAFMMGRGPSTPAEYDTPTHVDPAVVSDLARFFQTGDVKNL